MEQCRLALVLLVISVFKSGRGAAPSVVSPAVRFNSPYDTNNNVQLGSIVSLQLNVSFPATITPDVVIELLPSTNETIMALGAVTVSHVGTNTQITMPAITKYEADETKDKAVKYYTRGVYQLGSVNNNGVSGDDKENMVTIDFEAYLVSVGNYLDGEIFWISTGVEYNNSNNVWIGQVPVTIKTATPAQTKTPEFTLANVGGTTNVPVGSFAVLTIDARLPYPFSKYDIEAISMSTDESMRVISLQLKDAGDNYKFAFDFTKLTEAGVDCTSNPKGVRRLRQSLGVVPNKGGTIGTVTTIDDQMFFEALVFLSDNGTVGDTYPIGVGVEIDSTEVWVSYSNLVAVAAVGDSGTLLADYDLPNGNTVPVGGVSVININATFPEKTSQRYGINVVSTEKTSSKDPAIQVVSIVTQSQGQNILCPETKSELMMSNPSSGFLDKGDFDGNITNYGIHTIYQNANSMIISIIGVAVESRSTLGDVHKLTVTLTGGTGGPIVFNIELTIAGTMNFTNPVSYQFLLYHKCEQNCMSVGTYFDFFLDVTTERNSNPGRVRIEFPVPSNITNNIFSACEFEVIDIGKNVPCVSNAMLQVSANKTLNQDGSFERITLDISPLCNIDNVNDTKEDKFTVRMRAKIQNETGLEEGTKELYGVGVKYSTTQVWVAQMDIFPKKAEYFPGLAIVEGFAVNNITNESFPGTLQLQTSLDGITYKSKTVDWQSATSNGTHNIFTLSNPYITAYTRLASGSVCQKSCYVDHEFKTTSLEAFVDIFEDKTNSLLQQFPQAIDQDSSTCFKLPIQGDRPPVFWLRLNTTLLAISQNSFYLNVTGDGIKCSSHAGNRVIQVFYPTTSATDKFRLPSMKFCTLDNPDDVPSGVHTCKYRCTCPDAAQCGEVYLFMSNYVLGDNSSWTLCEITAANI